MKPIIELTPKQVEKFHRLLKRVGRCLEWQGTIGDNGRGQIMFSGVLYYAHRVAYFLAHGVDPGDKLVCHECDNPPCCKPSHLFLGTHMDNVRDCITKGRFKFPDPAHVRTYPNRFQGWDSASASLTEAQVKLIRRSDRPGTYFADLFGVSKMTISRVRRNKYYVV